MGLLDILGNVGQAASESVRAKEFGPDFRQKWQAYQDAHNRQALEAAIQQAELASKTQDFATKNKFLTNLHPNMDPVAAGAAEMQDQDTLRKRVEQLKASGMEQDQALAQAENERKAAAEGRASQTFDITKPFIAPGLQAKIASEGASAAASRAGAAHSAASAGLVNEELNRLKQGLPLTPVDRPGKTSTVMVNGEPTAAIFKDNQYYDANTMEPLKDVKPTIPGQQGQRLQTSKAAVMTINHIIGNLKSGAYNDVIGPTAGRAQTVAQWIGNPSNKSTRLGQEIIGLSQALSSIHGRSSILGAKDISRLMESQFTPESMMGALEGAKLFPSILLENAGMPVEDAGDGTRATPAQPAGSAADPFGIR